MTRRRNPSAPRWDGADAIGYLDGWFGPGLTGVVRDRLGVWELSYADGERVTVGNDRQIKSAAIVASALWRAGRRDGTWRSQGASFAEQMYRVSGAMYAARRMQLEACGCTTT